MAWREGYLAETSDMLGGMTSSNVKIDTKPSHGVVAVLKSLHFALP